jgi:hypothetical protein
MRFLRSMVLVLTGLIVLLGTETLPASANQGDTVVNWCNWGTNKAVRVSNIYGSSFPLYCGQQARDIVLVYTIYPTRVAQNYSNICYLPGVDVHIDETRDNKADVYTVKGC